VRRAVRRLWPGRRANSQNEHAPPPLSAEEWTRLAPGLLARGPSVIGATGGSGTRVVARIVRRCGLFIGTDLNKSEDALGFAAFYDGWINRYLELGSAMSADLCEAMTAAFRACVVRHLGDRDSEDAWGWKEPRSIFVLPFLQRELPTLRFLHVVRDGRDMAYSTNQNQLRKHGTAASPARHTEPLTPLRSIALWNDANLRAADFGERELRERYLRIRIEDLCAEPTATIETILSFFGLEGDAELIGREEVRPPATFGRWRLEDPETAAALSERASEGLRRFGYLPAAGSSPNHSASL
jgi:hypothetical protein